MLAVALGRRSATLLADAPCKNDFARVLALRLLFVGGGLLGGRLKFLKLLLLVLLGGSPTKVIILRFFFHEHVSLPRVQLFLGEEEEGLLLFVWSFVARAVRSCIEGSHGGEARRGRLTVLRRQSDLQPQFCSGSDSSAKLGARLHPLLHLNGQGEHVLQTEIEKDCQLGLAHLCGEGAEQLVVQVFICFLLFGLLLLWGGRRRVLS